MATPRVTPLLAIVTKSAFSGIQLPFVSRKCFSENGKDGRIVSDDLFDRQTYIIYDGLDHWLVVTGPISDSAIFFQLNRIE